MNAPNNHDSFQTASPIGEPKPHAPRVSRLGDEQAETEFVVWLLPGFSQICLASLIEPLRLANTLSRRRRFGWRLVSLDGGPVDSSSGIPFGVSGALADAEPALGWNKNLMICAGDGVERQASPAIRVLLRRVLRANVTLYALGTATWLLADAAVLRGSRCTIHWGRMAALSEAFEDVEIDDVLFVRDGQIVTCAGEFAAFDLAIDLVQRAAGAELARRVCQHLTADRWRDGATCQSAPPGLRYGSAGKKLMPIIRLMERHLEEPLSLEHISREASLSRRQMERLFRRYLQRTPWQHYLALRLAKAQQLIEFTAMPILDVAIASGFVSSSHFSKTFRDHFGVLPSDIRSQATGRIRRAAPSHSAPWN